MTVSMVIGAVFLALLVVVTASAIVTVEEGAPQALLVFGEMRAVLEPGLHVVPPFVSTTYPIDTASETIEKGDASVPIPEAFSEDVREVSRR